MMIRFIITGDCNGLTYYLFVGKPPGKGYAPDFVWHRLLDNATEFGTYAIAVENLQMVKPYVKIEMTIKEV